MEIDEHTIEKDKLLYANHLNIKKEGIMTVPSFVFLCFTKIVNNDAIDFILQKICNQL